MFNIIKPEAARRTPVYNAARPVTIGDGGRKCRRPGPTRFAREHTSRRPGDHAHRRRLSVWHHGAVRAVYCLSFYARSVQRQWLSRSSHVVVIVRRWSELRFRAHTPHSRLPPNESLSSFFYIPGIFIRVVVFFFFFCRFSFLRSADPHPTKRYE